MRRLWITFTLVMIFSFIVLGWIGARIYQEAPPLPDRVVTTDGTVVIDRGEIAAGQNVWQTLGGMEVGSIWGHGSYVAPDWSADWLHREAVFMLDRYAANGFQKPYEELSGEQQAQLRVAAWPSRIARIPTIRQRAMSPSIPFGPKPSRPTSLTIPTCFPKGGNITRYPPGPLLIPSDCAISPPSFSGPPGRPLRIASAITLPTRRTGPMNRWSETIPRASRWSGPA